MMAAAVDPVGRKANWSSKQSPGDVCCDAYSYMYFLCPSLVYLAFCVVLELLVMSLNSCINGASCFDLVVYILHTGTQLIGTLNIKFFLLFVGITLFKTYVCQNNDTV